MVQAVDQTGTGENTGTSVTCTFGGTPANGSVMRVGVSQNPASASNFGTITSSGWTQIGQVDEATLGFSRLTVMEKVAGASESTTPSFACSVSQDQLTCVGLSITGQHASTPSPNVFTQNNVSSAATATIPARTYTESDSMRVVFVGSGGNDGMGTTTWLSSWTQSLVEQADTAEWIGTGVATVQLASTSAPAAQVTMFTSSQSLVVEIESAVAVAGSGPSALQTNNYQGMNTLNGGFRS